MCRISEVGVYLCKIFSQKVAVVIAVVFGWLYSILFPEPQYLYGTLAILAMITLDLLTRLWALKRQAGGWIKAFKKHKITSKSFAYGTINKLAVFIVLMLMSAAAYQMMIISEIAVWFTQFVFAVLFITEGISIMENLMDAGCNVGFIKKVLKKKLESYANCDTDMSAEPLKKEDAVNNDNTIL